MTDFLPPLSKAMGLPLQSLRSIAKILGVTDTSTPEGAAVLVAFSHLQAYTAPEIALGILLDHKNPTVVGIINREWALLDEALVSLQDGALAAADAIETVFEQHTIDANWIASSLLAAVTAASQEAPPQPPSTAGADPTASAPGTP